MATHRRTSAGQSPEDTTRRRPSSFTIPRDAAQSLPGDVVDALELGDDGDLLVDDEDGPGWEDIGELSPWEEDVSAEMGGYDDDRGADADPDGDFADEPVEDSLLDEEFGEEPPHALRRTVADVLFAPRRDADGVVRFTVRLAPLPFRRSAGSDDERSALLADLVRERAETLARMAGALAELQQPFLQALAEGEPLDLAERALKAVTQKEVASRSGLGKDTVSRLAQAAHGCVDCPGAPSFSLSKLMARSHSLAVHPDALRAHIRHSALFRLKSAQVLDRLVDMGVLNVEQDHRKSAQEYLRQLCREMANGNSRELRDDEPE